MPVAWAVILPQPSKWWIQDHVHIKDFRIRFDDFRGSGILHGEFIGAVPADRDLPWSHVLQLEDGRVLVAFVWIARAHVYEIPLEQAAALTVKHLDRASLVGGRSYEYLLFCVRAVSSCKVPGRKMECAPTYRAKDRNRSYPRENDHEPPQLFFHIRECSNTIAVEWWTIGRLCLPHPVSITRPEP
jgi:hypothetical protein